MTYMTSTQEETSGNFNMSLLRFICLSEQVLLPSEMDVGSSIYTDPFNKTEWVRVRLGHVMRMVSRIIATTYYAEV